jgi:cyclic beta-1,2-glucan synthetase
LHKGRGGWTWYTGSAGWMYQMIIESFIGLKREGNTLQFNPCIPEEWGSVKIDYRYADIVYHIELIQTKNGDTTIIKILINGIEQNNNTFKLANDNESSPIKTLVYE